MKTFNIEADTVTDVDLGDFVLDEITVTIFDDKTIEITQPDFGDEASTIGLSPTQAEQLVKLLTGTVDSEEEDEKAIEEDIPLPISITQGVKV